MKRKISTERRLASVMVLGIGAFAHSTAQILADTGAEVCTYLTRDYGHFPPSLVGPTYLREAFPNPCALIAEKQIGLVVPMSIDWAQASWASELVRSRVPVFGPTGEAMRIERERDFARKLCAGFKIPFPRAHVAHNRLEAEKILARQPAAYVLKNPLCSPTSPIHTILCESLEDTRSWLKHVNYAEGVFLQEYLGRAEAGHIALVSGGEIYSLVTNQEYKRAFAGNMGIVAGAPLGGIVERDENDKHGLARQLIHPLLPWLREVKFNGPLQVTAIRASQPPRPSPSKTGKSPTGTSPVLRGKWHVIEYNVRIGVTSGAMILRMLNDPLDALLQTAQNRKLDLRFAPRRNFGGSITLAGYGYPYVQIQGPPLPVEITAPFDQDNCDVWWNEVARDGEGRLFTTGHRIADVVGFGASLGAAMQKAYANIRRIRSLGSYYREDIGQSLWPPGNE